MTPHQFRKGDILIANPKPCMENSMARDNVKYLNGRFGDGMTTANTKITDKTKFVVVNIDKKDKKMIDVSCNGITDSVFASRFILYKKKQHLDEGLFEL